MAINENSKIIGTFTIIERDLDGNIISESRHSNLITTIMKTALADVLTGDYDEDKHVIGYIAVGTDDTAADAGDTALGTQVGANKAPVSGSLNNDTSSVAAAATFFFDSTESTYYGTWKEIGLYAANGTDLLTHAVLDPTKTFNNTKTITVSYTITFS